MRSANKGANVRNQPQIVAQAVVYRAGVVQLDGILRHAVHQTKLLDGDTSDEGLPRFIVQNRARGGSKGPALDVPDSVLLQQIHDNGLAAQPDDEQLRGRRC